MRTLRVIAVLGSDMMICVSAMISFRWQSSIQFILDSVVEERPDVQRVAVQYPDFQLKVSTICNRLFVDCQNRSLTTGHTAFVELRKQAFFTVICLNKIG
jgi:hypothetical protein